MGRERCWRWLNKAARSSLAIVIVALLVRLAAVAYVTQFHSAVSHAEAGLGGEVGRIARSLAQGEGFTSPVHGRTGPTAWVAPVYPYFVAGVFQTLGVYSDASAVAIRVFNALVSALTCLVLFRYATVVFGVATGMWTAWVWALFPYSIQWSTLVWDTSLTTFLLAAACLVTVRLRDLDSSPRSAAFGALWGLAGLANPATLAVYPVALAEVYRRARPGPGGFARMAAVSSLALILILTPWTLRNARVFGEFIPIKGDLGYNLYLGNHAGATGLPRFELLPWNNAAELASYRTLGERAYFHTKEAEARTFISDHPREFLRLTATRVFRYWMGYWNLQAVRGLSFIMFGVVGPLHAVVALLALVGIVRAARTRRSQALLPAGAAIVFPLLYYVTVVSPRYRHPIEPLLVTLGVWVVVETVERVRDHRYSRSTLRQEATAGRGTIAPEQLGT